MTTEEDILRLMAQVRHLEEANAHETGRANQLAADLESLRASIIAACSGTKCLNAHELRQRLDKAEAERDVLRAEVKAWREWWDDEEGRWTTNLANIVNKRQATDAAKAMEEKCGS